VHHSRYCRAMNRTVICVSHETGADGNELGRLIAEKLGFRLVDEEIVTRAAENQKVSVDELADVERRKSLLARILREVAIGAATGPAEMFVTAYTAEPQPDKNSLRALIRQSISETADEGNVVIVSHAASYALPIVTTSCACSSLRRPRLELADSSTPTVSTRNRRRSRSAPTTPAAPTTSNVSTALPTSRRRTTTS